MTAKTDEDVINIPVGEFALPVPRIGSLDAHSGYGRATVEGQEIHQRVQRRRAKSDPLYQAEVPVSTVFAKDGFRFRINGRLDGIFRHELPVIEEIKSAFHVHDLRRRLTGDPFLHPYSLQLLSYGYFHWLEHGVAPRLTFHLVSSRNGRSEDLELTLDPERYRNWLELRLDELVLEAAEAKKRAARRRKMAAEFAFPFQAPRPGQVELMREIEQGMATGRPQLIQAPTGLGKTVGVLHPVLKEALARGQQVVYVTPKNSQHAVAEDAAERFRENGAKLRSLTVTAKSKICLKSEPICTPEYCEYARDYYGKLARHGVIALLAKKRKLKARSFRELGEQFEVCPFELQIDSAKLCDLVVCDYNYVFAPRSALGRASGLAVEEVGKPNLVIDEAHNLPARAMEYYSPRLSSAVLEGMREELRRVAPPFGQEAEDLLDDSLATVAACRSGQSWRPGRIELPLDPFLEQDGKLRAFLSRYLESDLEIGQEDPVLKLCYYWSEFTGVLEMAAGSKKQEFFTTFHPARTGEKKSPPAPLCQRGGSEPLHQRREAESLHRRRENRGGESPGGSVKITCCDASAMLRDAYGDYQQVVGFSATLKPFDYYAKLSGLDPATVATAEFASPFPRERRKLLVIPQISTRYSQRERNYGKIADALHRIMALRRGNYLAFFPSFDFMERVAGLFEAPAGYLVLGQERNMRQSHTDEILERLRGGEVPTVLFAVQGGSFSEGVDYAGEMAIGAFVIGPPLPTFDLEREEMRGYYQRHYGAGFEYAYVIPAMAKAIQAAGRVIRSESDRGLVVLMDNRFLEPDYCGSMPADWFEAEVNELVSESILKDVGEFWSSIRQS